MGVATEAIRTESSDFVARSKRYTKTFDGLLSKLDGHAGNLDKITQSHVNLASTVGVVQDLAQQAQATVGTIADAAGKVTTAIVALSEGGEHVRQTMEQLQATVTLVEGAVRIFQEEATRRLDELRAGPGDLVLTATNSLVDAMAKLQAQIAGIALSHQEASSGIAKQAETMLAVTKQHNEQLEGELKRSIDLVAKVHSSLSEMTERLARQVEARAQDAAV